ncbi:MAG: AbrB/MazE/SpoVT family DNA-binding domain-containing protein [Candidatus Bathyarchaeia archaeon]|jgi:AbrB family looped-hinge helix DNA binding protein
MALELTRLSQKGQVVIPAQVRRKMGLKEGTKFLVVGLEDIIVLRKLQLSEEKLKLKKLLAEARSSAKTHGLSEKEIERLIHAVRKSRE